MKRILLLSVVAFALLLNFSCEKDDKETEGSVVFWYDSEVDQWLYDQSIPSLSFYFDGDKVDGTTIKPYSSAPECGDIGSMTITKSLDGDKSKTFTYRVVNHWVEEEEGVEIWTGSVKLEDNTCTKLQLKIN